MALIGWGLVHMEVKLAYKAFPGVSWLPDLALLTARQNAARRAREAARRSEAISRFGVPFMRTRLSAARRQRTTPRTVELLMPSARFFLARPCASSIAPCSTTNESLDERARRVQRRLQSGADVVAIAGAGQDLSE
jgi:hypothetical protein